MFRNLNALTMMRGIYTRTQKVPLYIPGHPPTWQIHRPWHVCRTVWHDDDDGNMTKRRLFALHVVCPYVCWRHAMMRVYINYHRIGHRACSCAQRLHVAAFGALGFGSHVRFLAAFPAIKLKVPCFLKYTIEDPALQFKPWELRQKASLLPWMQSIYACL